MEYKNILYNVQDRIARITLNRPEKRNALSFELRREVVHALRAAEADDDVTVILIDGAGPSFCSGYDITPSRQAEGSDGAGHSLEAQFVPTAGWSPGISADGQTNSPGAAFAIG